MSNQQQLLLGQATAMVKKGNVEGLKTLPLSSVIDMFNDKAKTLLVVACEIGNLEMVRELLKVGGVDVNKGYQDTGTALYNACEGGHLEIVRELLSQSGIDVNKGRHFNFEASPLFIACKKGHLEIVQLLLSRPGIDLNKGESPLYYACENGHLEIVKELLHCGRKINVNLGPIDYPTGVLVDCPPNKRLTPLHAALKGKYLEIVKELLKCSQLEVQGEMEFAKTCGIDLQELESIKEERNDCNIQ